MYPVLPLIAGSAIAFKYDADGTLDKKIENAIANPGVLESIERTHSVEAKEFPNGNSQYPMTIRDIKTNDRFRLNFSSFQPALYALFAGETIADKENITMSIVGEKRTIGNTNYNIELAPSPTSTGMLLVAGVDNESFEEKVSAPAKGEFSVSGDTLTFNSADAGKEVFISYDYQASNATVSSASTAPARPDVHLIIGSKVASQPGDRNIYRSNTVIDKCKAVGDLNPPAQKADTDGWSIEVQVLEPRGGYPPVETLYDKEVVN